MTTGRRQIHLCGYAEQHYRLLHDELGVRVIDGPGQFVDNEQDIGKSFHR